MSSSNCTECWKTWTTGWYLCCCPCFGHNERKAGYTSLNSNDKEMKPLLTTPPSANKKPIYETEDWNKLSDSVKQAITRTSQEIHTRFSGSGSANTAENGTQQNENNYGHMLKDLSENPTATVSNMFNNAKKLFDDHLPPKTNQ